MPAAAQDRVLPDTIIIKRWETWMPRVISLVAVVLSLCLAGMLWFVYRAVNHASAVLIHGQASEFLQAANDWTHSLHRPPWPGDFDAFLPRHWQAGLRYVAFVRPRSTIIDAQAGTPAKALDEQAIRSLWPMAPVDVGMNRVRVMLGPPGSENEPEPGRGHPPPDDIANPEHWGPPDHPPGDDGRPRPGPPPGMHRMVIEFEPLQARQVEAYARRSLWIGIFAIPAFLGGAIFLAFLVRQREQLAQRLGEQRRLAALGEMAAVIAHEIRNPLASLKGHAQLLHEMLFSTPQQAKAQRVVNEAVRLQNLVTDLLEFSRSGVLRVSPTDPIKLLRDSAEAVDGERIVLHTETAPPSWVLDPARMQQALCNLMRNAVQASPHAQPVEASVCAENGALVFEVRDHGEGIPAGEEARIFEPFYTRTSRGTGLGLPLVHRIVTQHHGTISVRNAPDGGAIFRVCLRGNGKAPPGLGPPAKTSDFGPRTSGGQASLKPEVRSLRPQQGI